MNRSLRIAIADDGSDMQEYYRTILPPLGHVVVAIAETGHELVEKCPGQHRLGTFELPAGNAIHLAVVQQFTSNRIWGLRRDDVNPLLEMF